MISQSVRHCTPRNQHASLHVLLHRVASEIGAGDEARGLVGDSDFGVHSAIRKITGLVAPCIELRAGHQASHLANDVDVDAAAMVLRGLQQHGDAHAALIGCVQCLDDGRHVVGHEAGDEQRLFSGIDDLQKRLLCSTR